MKRSHLVAFIEKRLAGLGVSKTELARRAGISRSELYKLLAQDVGEARLSTLARLARALEAPLPLLLGEALGNAVNLLAGITVPARTGDALGVVRSDDEECVTVAAGEESVLTIRLCNIGTVAWRGRRLVCLDGHTRAFRNKGAGFLGNEIVLIEPEIPIPITAPGGVAQFNTRLRAPKRSGTVRIYWKMIDEHGAVCFPGMADVVQKLHVFGR